MKVNLQVIRRNKPCRLQSDLGFAPAAGVGFRSAGTGRSDGGGEVETWILAGVVFRVSDDTSSAKMHSEWLRKSGEISEGFYFLFPDFQTPEMARKWNPKL